MPKHRLPALARAPESGFETLEPESAALVAQMRSLMLQLMPEPGFAKTAIEGLTLMRAEHSSAPAPVLQEAAIVCMVQGLKRGYLGDCVYRYQVGQCLVLAVPMQFACDTVVRTGEPMLAFSLRIDAATVLELCAKMAVPARRQEPRQLARGMAVANTHQAFLHTQLRLLQALASPQEAMVLGPALRRELHYRVLQTEAADCLRATVAWQGGAGQVQRAIERIRLDFASKLDVDGLARDAAMSASAFHQAFKSVTGHSPIQYLKATRLHKARELMLERGMGAAQAAYQVGYASPNQFSREYKRLFAHAPSEALTHAPAPGAEAA